MVTFGSLRRLSFNPVYAIELEPEVTPEASRTSSRPSRMASLTRIEAGGEQGKKVTSAVLAGRELIMWDEWHVIVGPAAAQHLMAVRRR